MDDLQLFLSEYEASSPTQVLPSALENRYHVLSCLKSSETSQIYLLTGAQDGALCILRVAPIESMPRLLREHRLLLQLHDPAFPHPIACFFVGEHAYLVREYIPGRSLADLIENGDLLPRGRAAEIARKVCAIVQKLHAMDPPVIHRDIKPQNIILSPDDTPHLIDFDTVQEHDPEKPLDTVVMGTAMTAAPEQFGYHRCDPRTDVYGIGMLLHFLLTGNYEADRPPRSLKSGSLGRIVHKCLQFDPRARYASAGQLQKKLLHYRQRLGRRIAAGLAAAVLVSSAAGLYMNREAVSAYAPALFAQPTQAEYTFASPLVERAVRLQLNRPSGAITREEMVKIQELYLCGEEAFAHWEDAKTFGADIFLGNAPYDGYGLLQDMGDFEYLPNLRKLALYRLALNDLTALKGLPLTHLGIGGNHITDISLLSSFPGLKELDISDNPITSLEALKNCPLLHVLKIGATPVHDLNPLRGLALDTLCLYDMPQDTDFSVLSDLTGLRTVEARALPQHAVNLLLEHTPLESILLFFCGVDSLAPFANMPNLTYLNLLGNNLTNLDGIQQLTKLRYLDVGANDLAQIDALAGHPALETIRLPNNPVKDLSPLESIPTLVSAMLSRGQEELFSRPADTLGFQIMYGE